MLGNYPELGVAPIPQTLSGQFLSPQEIANDIMADVFQRVGQIGTGII